MNRATLNSGAGNVATRLPLRLAPFLAMALAGCSSGPQSVTGQPKPAWVTQPTRTVDNGYIVYVGQASDLGADRAQFKAESAAAEDLANECSFIPKGVRTEDRYLEHDEHGYHSYAKLGIEYGDCEQAKNTNDPEQIRKESNPRLTAQLAQYQQLVIDPNAGAPDQAEPDQQGTPVQLAAASGSAPGSGGAGGGGPGGGGAGGVNSELQFFAARQQVAYYKEVVILSPPATYAPGTPQATQFTQNVTQASSQVQTYEKANPVVRTWPRTWSSLENKPAVAPPPGMRRANSWAQGGRYNPGARKAFNQQHSNKGKKRRRRNNRNWNGNQ